MTAILSSSLWYSLTSVPPKTIAYGLKQPAGMDEKLRVRLAVSRIRRGILFGVCKILTSISELSDWNYPKMHQNGLIYNIFWKVPLFLNMLLSNFYIPVSKWPLLKACIANTQSACEFCRYPLNSSTEAKPLQLTRSQVTSLSDSSKPLSWNQTNW